MLIAERELRPCDTAHTWNMEVGQRAVDAHIVGHRFSGLQTLQNNDDRGGSTPPGDRETAFDIASDREARGTAKDEDAGGIATATSSGATRGEPSAMPPPLMRQVDRSGRNICPSSTVQSFEVRLMR